MSSLRLFYLNRMYSSLSRRYSTKAEFGDNSNGNFPKVVVAGSGWAATNFVKNLDRAKFDTYIISPRNFFTFTPLLPFVSSGKIFPEACTESLHSLYKTPSAKLILSEAQDVDFDRRILICSSQEGRSLEIPYDYLVIAIGAKTNTFNIPNVEKYGFFLKDISDAKAIHDRLHTNCENASMPNLTQQEIEDLCRIVIVGGGPTGVETAACINEFIIRSLSHKFPHLKEYLKVHLVESGKTLLSTFSPKISKFTVDSFKKDGIVVNLNSRMNLVESNYCEMTDVETGEKSRLGCGMVIWVSGLCQQPFASKVISKLANNGKQVSLNGLNVDQYLRLKGFENVFAMGDCAIMIPDKLSEESEAIAKLLGNKLTNRNLNKHRNELLRKYPQMSKLKWTGPYDNKNLSFDDFTKALSDIDNKFRSPVPTAQNARQEGVYLANVFNDHIYLHGSLRGYRINSNNEEYVKPFCEVWRGSIAYIGLKKAAFKLPLFELYGKTLLYTFWRLITIDMLMTFRSKFTLFVSWIFDKMFGEAAGALTRRYKHD